METNLTITVTQPDSTEIPLELKNAQSPERFSLLEYGPISPYSPLASLNSVNLQAYMNNCIDIIFGIITDEKITVVNALEVCIALMQFVERIPHISGPQKRELVLMSVKHVVLRGRGDLPVLDLVPNFIEFALNIEKGTVSIHNITDTVAKTAFLCCGSGNKK